MTKSQLRKLIRIRLEGLSLEERAAQSAHICLALSRTEEWKQATTVAFFSPLPSEPNVDLLWSVLESRVVCYPRIHGDDLLFVSVPDRAALLESNRWNLLEPEHDDDKMVALKEIDLLLVPGLAFTMDGRRLGRGKGFYDRLLSAKALRAPSFGVCFAQQLVPHLPTEVHDQPVSRVIYSP